MTEQHASKWLPQDDKAAIELRLAVHAGDMDIIRRLLHSDPELATARLVGQRRRCTTPRAALTWMWLKR